MRVLAALCLLAVLAPVAGGQSVAPASALTLTVPPGPVKIPLGQGHELPIEVGLRLENLVCTQDAEATVTYAIQDVPSPLAGVQAMTDAPAALAIPMGAYTSATPFGGKATSTLTINVAPNAPGSHTHTFSVTASFAGGSISGCQGAGAVPAAEAQGDHTIETGPAAPGGAATGGSRAGPGNASAPAGPPPNDTAVPAARPTPAGAALALVAFAAVAFVARRRR